MLTLLSFLRVSFLLLSVMADININQSLKDIVDAIAAFAGGAASLAFLRAGYLWMFADDNYQQEAKARNALGAAIVGSVICLGAVTLSNLVIGKIK